MVNNLKVLCNVKSTFKPFNSKENDIQSTLNPIMSVILTSGVIQQGLQLLAIVTVGV
jgi:hypothetical protein